VETRWHGTVLYLIIMLNGAFVLQHMLVDGNYQEWCFTRGFPLKLHREFLF
jgi:hypothetical protein